MPSSPRYRLYYWPIPFRGCFVSYLFAYRDAPLEEASSFEDIKRRIDLPPAEQDVPFIGPPVLADLENGNALSQMPAIVLYLAPGLDLAPADPFERAMAMKVLMDCNDVLMEICRYNGSSMWQRDEWRRFRSERLPRWLAVFEESLRRGHIGNDEASFADIAVYALFGNMLRCLPALDADVRRHAPGVYAHCERIVRTPSLARYVEEQAERYGTLYCGGQIEASIRDMLEQDARQEG
jgi:glutathione S-transferase